MCGLAGFVDFNKVTSESILKKMTDALTYRGPDDSGNLLYDEQCYQIGLGHRRLSILDLSFLGHQPMSYSNLDIVYNGEVYNFKEIRQELIKVGFSFQSDSDTEVILKSFNHWGNDAVNKFNGMFVITLYDKEKQTIKIFRDRAGVKPLYWSWNKNLFLFSSELKSFSQHPAFEKKINIISLGLFLQYGYIPQPYSIFEHTHKLKAGYYLELDLVSKKIKENRYWNIVDYFNKPKLNLNINEAVQETERLLQSAFEYRMVSDVPVGMFLSGGYDSSITTAILQKDRTEKVNTFTIGFKEKGYDEAPFAKKVANHLGTNHTEYYCTQKDALAIIPKLPEIYDEPFGDSSAIPTILVSQLAKKDVTVSLSADGGDEIFAGYSKYQLLNTYHNKFAKIPFRKELSKLLNQINPKSIPFTNSIRNFDTKYGKLINSLNAQNCSETLKFYSEYFTANDVNKLLIKPYESSVTNFDYGTFLNKGNDNINSMLATDYQTYMVDDVLTKVDRATMSVSLEGREPLLDYRIAEFAAQLPSDLKVYNGVDKYILKEITHKYIPKKFMERPKMGFAVPIYDWFKDELKELFYTYLNEERLAKEQIFNVSEVIKLRDKYFDGKRENIRRLWFILMFEMWYEKWM